MIKFSTPKLVLSVMAATTFALTAEAVFSHKASPETQNELSTFLDVSRPPLRANTPDPVETFMSTTFPDAQPQYRPAQGLLDLGY